MLSIFNKYLHGYIVVPCYVALEKKGFFEFLRSPNSLESAVSAFTANPGHLRVALRVFESLGWIVKDDLQQFQTTSKFPLGSSLPQDISSLYQSPVELYLSNTSTECVDEFIYKLNIDRWMTFIKERWQISNERLAEFLDSAIILPLLYLIKRKLGLDKDRLHLASISKVNQAKLIDLFGMLGLGQNEGMYIQFSSLGQVLWENIFNAGVVLSYRPMLSNIDNLIFNSKVKLDLGVDQSYVSRELNVVGSGTQHQSFFSDFQSYVRAYTDKLSPENPISAIVDMGCGDGSLLKSCYDAIAQKADVRMVGADVNLVALKATSAKLGSIPHETLQGDIGDPNQLLLDLGKLGIDNKDKILHIRSFLDHDRVYTKPVDVKAVEQRKQLRYVGIYVDRQGQLIPQGEVIQNLVEYFKDWSEIIGNHGLITLEVFCLAPEIIAKYLDETESLHFDACHGFSGQLLVEADVYLMCAAENGLFTAKNRFKKYPTTLPYTRISRQHFLKYPYIIRHAQLSDLDVLMDIEKETTAAHLRSSKAQLLSRLTEYPQGQYVMELNGEIIGMLYTQRIDNVNKLYEMKYENIEDYYVPSGPIVQLIGLYIALKHQGLGLSDRLLEFGLIHNFVRNGVTRICGISRCYSYAKNSSIPLEEYIHLRTPLGYLKDPILRLHDQMGADIKGLVPNFRTKDIENKGAGVHIEYTFSKWQKKVS